MEHDLNWIVHFRSGGSGPIRSTAAVRLAGTEVPRRRRAGNSPKFVILDVPGSIRAGFGSGMHYVACMIDLGHYLGNGRPATASAATAAGLRVVLDGAHAFKRS